jgi:beta-lactamase superfamily II metal-dependent hydrolase
MQKKCKSNGDLKRTFHSVGQGAFYTERFDMENHRINVVYDCGSSTGEKILKERIDNAFSKDETIDALFVSHFHADHINGIDHLLERCVVKKIFLPLLDSRAREIMLILCRIDGYANGDFVYRFIENPSNAANGIIAGKNTSSDSPDIGPDIIEISETPENNEVPLGDVTGIIGSGKKVTVADSAVTWIYLPFNFRAEVRHNELHKYIKDKCQEIDFTKIIENWDNYKGLLVDIYNHIPGDLNTNSLVIYSGPKKRIFKRRQTGCLFLGDYNLNGRQVWNSFERAYKDYFKDTLVLQVPHHGSKYNFNDKVTQKQIPCFVISARENSSKHPDKLVKCILNGKCFLVTEEPDSCFSCRISLHENVVLHCSHRKKRIPDLIGLIT